MSKIMNLSKTLNEFFNKKANDISIATGFIKRNRKIKGSSFIKALVLGNMGNVTCSIDSMCQLLNEDSVEITRQGLHFRFTATAVKFMERMYLESLDLLQNKLQLGCQILQQFKTVKLLDSTYIALSNSMEDQYKGCGSAYPSKNNNAKSAVKLQLVFDYLNQFIDKLDITEGIRADQGYRDYLKDISENDLIIADLGYFVPDSFQKISDSGAYFISRYKTDTNIYDVVTNQKLELLDLLNDQSFVTMEVLLGKQVKLKVRIICHQLTAEESEGRRRKANKLAKSHGYQSSTKNQQLLDWSIFITNIPEDKITAQQIRKIYRVRWQIELLFKLYKSHIKIGNLKAKFKSHRILCELYAKLCFALIFHGIASCVELKNNTEISLTKALIELKRRSRELLLSLNNSVNQVKDFLEKLVLAFSKFSLKDKHRKTRISTLSSLKLLVSGVIMA